MKLLDDSPKSTGKLLRFLEKKFDAGEADAKVLKVVQRRLDAIETGHRNDKDYLLFYPVMLEIQALIHLQNDKKEEGEKFLTEAVKRSRGPALLQSPTLKEYIANNDLQFGMADFTRLTEKQRKYLWSRGIDETSDIRLFTRQPLAFLGLTIATLGLYQLVWIYKNWQAIRDGSHARLSPFWRTFFNIFWLWPLFKIILAYTRAQGVGRKYPAGLLTAAYIVIGCGSSFIAYAKDGYGWLIPPMAVVLLLEVGIFLVVQRNAYEAAGKQQQGYSPFGKGETIFTALALAYVALITIQMLSSPWLGFESTKAKIRADLLTAQYELCSQELSKQYAATDQSDDAAVAAYNQRYDECEAIHADQERAIEDYQERLQ